MNSFGQIQRVFDGGVDMKENCGPIPDEHHSEMGGAGWEGFAEATGRGALEVGDDNVDVEN